MTRFAFRHVVLFAAAACAGRAAGPDVPPAPAPPPGEVPASRAPVLPRDVGTIMILDVSLPPAGRTIGGHYEGAAFATRSATLQMSDGLRLRWARGVRAAGDSMLRARGYAVQSMGPPSSDAAPLRGVRFGLSAEVTDLSVSTTGRVAPILVDAHAETVWELLDLASGGLVLAMRTNGTVRLTDSVDVAAVLAMARTLDQLLADSSFLRALASPPPRRLEDMIFAPEWSRALPGPFDTIKIEVSDLNPSSDLDLVQRVAHGVFAVHGTVTGSFTAFTITRDGLAIASGVLVHERRLWGRFHDGADHPVRILRARDDVMLLQIRCDQPCATVPWSDTEAVAEAEPVFTLAGPRFVGDALYLAYGRMGARTAPDAVVGAELRIDGDLDGGEPVARRDNGTVVAVASKGRAIRIAEAFRQLGMSFAPPR